MKTRVFRVSCAWSVLIIILGFLAECKSPASSENDPTILLFRAVPDTIDKRQTTTLYWTTEGADTAAIDNGIGSVPANGQLDIDPATTTVYTLTAGSATGSATKATTVTVVEVAIFGIDGVPERKINADGHPYYDAYIKNFGSKAGYNCIVSIRAYSDTEKTTVIDTAIGHPADGGNIEPDQRVRFEAIYYNLSSWDQVKADQYVVTWSNITAY